MGKSILVGVFLVFVALPTFTQEVMEIPATSNMALAATPLESRLKEIWYQALSHLDEGNTAQAGALLPNMLNSARREETYRLTPFAYALLGKYYQFSKTGKALEAELALMAARSFNPSLPEVALAEMKRHYASKDFIPFFKESLTYVVNLLKAKDRRIMILANGAKLFLFIFLIAALIISSILVLRYFPLLVHDVQEHIPEGTAKFFGFAVAVILLIWPILYGFSLTFVIGMVFIVFYAYATPKENTLVLTLTAVILLLSISIFFLLREHRYTKTSIYQACLALATHDLAYPHIGEIENLNLMMGNHPDLLYILGHLYQRSGDYTNAQNAFQLILQKEPTFAKAYASLGYLYYRQNKFVAAIDAYKKALQYDQTNIKYFYNLYACYNNNYQYEEAQQVLRDATALNSSAINAIMAKRPDIILQEIPLSYGKKLIKQWEKEGVLKGKKLRGYEPHTSLIHYLLQPLWMVGLLVFILGPLHKRYRESHGGVAQRCSKCGKSFCRRCKRASETQLYCTQCVYIYIKKDGVPLDVKVNKVKQIERYHQRKLLFSKVINLFIPGYGIILAGNTFRGMRILLGALFCGSLLFHFFNPLPVIQMDLPSPGFFHGAIIFFLFILFILANIPFIFEKVDY